MEIYNQIAEINVNLVHLLHTQINVHFDKDDSTDKSKLKDTSHSITSNLNNLLNEYKSNLTSLESNQSLLPAETGSYTTSLRCYYPLLFKDASERLPESEFNDKIHESVLNGILIFVQYLSPSSFTWHIHINHEEPEIRLCCKFGSVPLQDIFTHYYTVSTIFSSLCQMSGFTEHSVTLEKVHKHLDNVVRRINGMVSLIYLPLKNNFRFNPSTYECSYEDPKNVDTDLYNKANSHYNMFPTPCKLAILGSSLICKCYTVLLAAVPNGEFKCYNFMISTLLIIYNKTTGFILDDIYDLLIQVVSDHTDAFKEYSNLLLFKEVINKMSDDVNNYNDSVEKCTDCYIRLTSVVFSDKELKIYELLEALVDRIKLMNKNELKQVLMRRYHLYLEKVPLACAATMLQTMELVFSTIDSFDKRNVSVSLKCLEDIFRHLPNDAIYYFADTYCRFIFIYVKFLSNDTKCEDSLKDLEKLNFLNGLIVKFGYYSDYKFQDLAEDRERVMISIRNILNITRNSVGEGVFKNIICKINSEISNDPNTSDHTLNVIRNFSNMFQL